MTGHWPSLEDLTTGTRLLASLPRFLRQPISPQEATATVRARLCRREEDFLAVARRFFFDAPESPYRLLLDQAGCELGDLVRIVRREGLEAALRALYLAGVYLTVDELKGRRPTVRGGTRFEIDPARLRPPGPRPPVAAHSGGSRGTPTSVFLSLLHVRDRAIHSGLPLALRGGSDWSTAVWGVPGGSLNTLLRYCLVGRRPSRWFLQVPSDAVGLHPRYVWSARVARLGSVMAALPLPRPRYVGIEDPRPIARWMADVLRAGGVPHLDSFTSPVVRLCQAAEEAGIDLRGAQFTVAGEALTATRRETIRRTGAEVLPRYAIAECGLIGYGCLAPSEPDDTHFLADCHALLQPAAAELPRGLPSGALFLTSLRTTAPLPLLNVSFGDQVVLERRHCGCPLEAVGWTEHLHTIRSFEKVTAGGMTFPDLDVVRVLEEALPARFGGGPTDYQIVEAEDGEGRPRVTLRAHPRLGPLDGDTLREAFLEAIGSGSGSLRVMALQWRGADLLRVERRAPEITPRGKILHLHTGRRGSPPAPR